MNKFSELAYARPDIDVFSRSYEELTEKLSRAGSYAEFKEAFFALQELTEQIETAYVTAHIRNNMNTADEFYDAEMDFFNDNLPKLAVMEKKMNTVLASSPFRGDFSAEFGDQFYKIIEADMRTQGEEAIAEMQRENALVSRYSRAAAACHTQFAGENCNFYGLLKHMLSPDREMRRSAFKAWSSLYASAAEELEKLYCELVKTRVAIAEKLGFDDYISYAYLSRHRFDYSRKDVEAFRRTVKEYVVPAVAEIYKAQATRLGIDKIKFYDEELVFPEGNAAPAGDRDYLVASARKMYRELSPETGEFFDFMTEHELFDLDTRPDKRLGGYCTELAAYGAPFIFANFNGTAADVDVLTHEAGHAFAGFTSAKTCRIDSLLGSTSEVNEIHSMSMEHFTYPWMERMFGENADKYRYAHVISSLKVLPYMMCVDEFQHRVFDAPDTDAAGLRKIWRELEKIYMPWRDYDGDEFLESGGFWMQKQHIFMYPFYYIDYALAQICAFQFYAKMKKDRRSAWGDYMKLCRLGGSRGYFALLEAAGLESPFRAESVKAAVAAVMEDVHSSPF